MSIIGWLFGTARFVPHGVCLLWRPDLVAIHVISDGLIALSYFAIPGVIWWFVARRADLAPEHRRIARLFVAFITACGLTHVAAMITLWAPYYGLQALIKLWTAGVSVTTAAYLPVLAPKLLSIPSPKALQAANVGLEAEVAAHRATLRELEEARARLQELLDERTEDVRVMNERFAAGLRNSPVTLLEQDEALRYTWAFNTPLGLADEFVIGRTEQDFMTPETAETVQSIKLEALGSGDLVEREVYISEGERGGWFLLRAEPMRLRDGRPGVIASSIDITAQKRQQEHLELVMRELNHRSKNLLTIVQSIARQTAVGLEVPPAYMTRLSERLRALASAHDVLVQGDWRGANLRAVIEGQLTHQLQAAKARITLTGERFELPPEMAHYLGLAVHELGANAVKYGALSNETGRVEVAWALEVDEQGRRSLRFEWRETGGPPVGPPTLRGFGRTILELLTPRAIGGRAALAFEEAGLSWTLSAPIDAPAPAYQRIPPDLGPASGPLA